MSDKKAVIKNANMSDEMQQDAVDCAMTAVEKDIAAFVKKELDEKYNPTWHCIDSKHLIYFYLGQVAILLFKSG
ncbi:dynein light chain 2, cytoplasmic-like [Gouania willdenowi]|uniref:dynein light chain 2, cytoplasmic-like n=1 Tax=Gouania willdenowi TaxID=441366 RepID=UPI001055FD7A|nr:dynein light chain 2, cytoplasmic-like [Gouania willdenowi]